MAERVIGERLTAALADGWGQPHAGPQRKGRVSRPVSPASGSASARRRGIAKRVEAAGPRA
jgi:hypothetical protein